MRRALFLLEFRRALFPVLTLAVSVMIVIAIIESFVVARRGANPTTAAVASQILLLSGIALSGLFAGSRVFSREFKERHYPLLATLPVAPAATWLVLMASGLAASVVALVGIVLIRPRLVGDAASIQLLALASAAHLYLFAFGSCLVLLLRRFFLVPVLGFPAAAAVLFETLSFQLTDRPPVLPLLYSPGAIVTFVFFVLASMAIYVRGEFDLPKVRLRNQAGLWCTLLGIVAMLRWLHPTPFLATGSPAWAGVSTDGRVIEREERCHDGRFAISFASGESGRPLGRWSGPDVLGTAWAPDESVLFAVVRPEPLFRTATFGAPLPAVLVRIAPDGRERSRHPLEDVDVQSIVPFSLGRAALFVSNALTSAITVLAASGEPRAVEAVDPAPPVRLRNAGENQAIAYSGIGPKLKAWRCTPDRIERLEVVPSDGPPWPYGPIVIGSRAFFSPEQAQEEMRRLYPSPPEVPRGTFVFASPLAVNTSHVFFLSRWETGGADIYSWEVTTRRWLPVARGARWPREKDPWVWSAPPISDYRSAFNLRQGLVVYKTPHGGGFETLLYDASIGRSLQLGAPSPSETYPYFAPFPSPSAVFVESPESPAAETFAVFRYEVGSGTPTALPSVSKDVLLRTLHRRGDGSRIVTSGDGLAIRLPDGAEQPIRFR